MIRVFRRRLDLVSVLFYRPDKEEWIDLGCATAKITSLSMVLLGIECSVGYSVHIDPAFRVNTNPWDAVWENPLAQILRWKRPWSCIIQDMILSRLFCVSLHQCIYLIFQKPQQLMPGTDWFHSSAGSNQLTFQKAIKAGKKKSQNYSSEETMKIHYAPSHWERPESSKACSVFQINTNLVAHAESTLLGTVWTKQVI